MNLALLSHAGSPLPWFMLLVLGAAVGLLGGKWLRQNRRRSPTKSPCTSSPNIPLEKTLETDYSEAAYYDIEPLTDFDYEKEEPLKIRPFKPKYHLTMALENTTLSDLIAMDNTYLSRLAIRRQLIQAERREIIACTPEAEPAVKELYEWLIGTYLPRRFPTIYTLINPNSNTTGKDAATHLKNHATNTLVPLTITDPDLALQIIGENIDTEFLLLQKHPSSSPQDQQQPYRLTAFINCFPAGFSTLSKLGLSLAAIHSPIPHYSEKLEKSMDRYFASLPVGRIVKRVNWSINTTPELFCLGGTHMSEEQHQRQQKEGNGEGNRKEEEVDIEKTVLRCERQTLHRLPKTGALVFAFKTYTYPLDTIRAEGNAEALAQATKGLGLGSVPRMTVYKREVVWGEKVRAFLRGGGEM